MARKRAKHEYLVTVKIGTEKAVTKSAVKFWVASNLNYDGHIGDVPVKVLRITRVDLE